MRFHPPELSKKSDFKSETALGVARFDFSFISLNYAKK